MQKTELTKQLGKGLSKLTVAVVIFVSLYVFFYKGLGFDGAFHSQAAINLYKTGKYITDYPIGFTQIKVPFQLVNGFFLSLFGLNFLSANLANILFYLLLAWLIFKLHKQYKSPLILLGLILISFSPGFITYGFRGYGEIPGLFFGILGLWLITKEPGLKKSGFLGGFLIGIAIATKWVFVLILVPFGLIVMLRLMNKEFRLLAFSIIGFVLPLFIFWSIEYANYVVNLKQLFNTIFLETSPVNTRYYSSYSERLAVFWQIYVHNSGGYLIVALKVFAYLFLLLFFIISGIMAINKKKLLASSHFFVLILSLFALE